MPQLDKLTFVSQLFWFFLLFFILYIILCQLIIPEISGYLKLRQIILGQNSIPNFNVDVSRLPKHFSNIINANIEYLYSHLKVLSHNVLNFDESYQLLVNSPARIGIALRQTDINSYTQHKTNLNIKQKLVNIVLLR